MRGISEEKLRKFQQSMFARENGRETELRLLTILIDECKELREPWMTLEEFLKSGFVGKCWVFSENIVLETEYDTNGFWYVFKYIDQNTITHVKPIHKPEPPR